MSTPASILLDIENTLRPLIEGNQGSLDVVQDVDSALEALTENPKGWRVILLWDGHLSDADSREGMTRAGLTTFLHMSKGMRIKPALHRRGANGKQSFLASLEVFSKWMRALRWPADTVTYEANMDPAGLSLESSSWVSDTPKNTLAHGITWAVRYSLEAHDENILIAPA